ncbi:M23 family metallopeptidase [Helicobacter brantae]|uniref:Peptidase n=1 Tax=Helicobacter brantae TaxID=375927 RepID=A0A3D8J1X4_9HELI|nr:M23 family metallopeptidase [Helicobacter brantae]RDU71517.1 peptidase [Helicobacter brantae]
MFSNRLVLMITDSKGSRILNINAFFKRIAFYIVVFILTLIFFSIISISVFRHELEYIAKNNNTLLSEYQKLLDKNSALNDKIDQRVEELALVGDRVEHLEDLVGLPLDGVPSDTDEYEKVNYGLQDRLEVASLAGVQKAFVMKFIPNGYPMDYYRRISDTFGYRIHPILQRKHLHAGVDFSAEIGTPIYATADGVVEFARKDYNGGYGNLIKIDHSFGFKTYYAHLNDLLVKRGDFVKKGQIIAYSGNSGISTGPHLHYEIRFLGAYIDPQIFIEWNMRDFDLIFTKEINIPWQSLLATINNLMEQMELPSSQVAQK